MKLTIYIHAKKETWEDDFTYHGFTCDMTSCGYTLLGTLELDFTPPERKELIAKQIASLQEKQNNIRAAAEHTVQEIQHEIGKLLALEAK